MLGLSSSGVNGRVADYNADGPPPAGSLAQGVGRLLEAGSGALI